MLLLNGDFIGIYKYMAIILFHQLMLSNHKKSEEIRTTLENFWENN